ncbi:two-partner secretion domain-containing protein [Trinickia symbiotica]|uniref:Filamentous haemagglutinin FhaB/tRNA nuclease CdiA-like TPS domain-containing protein n=1 Tax=Trinickia symbiotica TaxID=863227 RepID=A0A2N7WVG1_9BURK|nr:filamentous hemagglutinin N-terminal domain-containing protein [Trinickia symbiotica]PMS33439.1 hypothetical protein C0Z20_24320 [Trinickia symbiotica]
MNHAYSLIWNQAANAWVVAPETARAHRKGGKLKAAAVVVASAVIALNALNAHALPTGGQVSSGSGTISQSGSTMTVNQGTQNLSVNWNSFNIGATETVNYVQPNRSAIALNRVLGSDPSAIYGKLNANGQVFLVNPNGILFGKGAQVNVGGLVASTQNISDTDFLNRNFHFAGTAGSVVNQGAINANYVALLGGQVSNQGTITAKLGTVALAAGSDITLDFAGDGLIGVQVNQGTLNALAENKQLIQADGGTVVLTAKAANSLISAVVNNSGVIEAASVANQGGTIKLLGDTSAGIAQNSGSLNGSEVNVSARSVLQTGTVSADTANLAASFALIQTDGASVSANSVRMDGGEHSFISGTLKGANDLTVAGQTITLAGAALATGENGSIRVGGGAHGQDTDIANAQTVAVNGATTITGGDGAHVTVWSDGTTNYFGNTSAGKNSFVEVSSKGTLNLGGTVSVGDGSQILYDPANLVIDASPTSSMFYLDLADPSAAAGNQHGSGGVTELSNGNIVVSSPQDNFGASGAGAVYLYNGRTGALISTLTGSNANDAVGSNGITTLANGNYVVDSASWNGNMGAVTWGSGTSGVSGVVSSSNSLVGSTAGDYIGAYGITALAHGNYVVDSARWNGNMGAVTWGSGTSGVSGTVSSANSLVGSNANDFVGNRGITTLANGNYVVDSGSWNGNRGAVTWGSGTSGVSGTVSSANSLVGSNANDSVGSNGITTLANGNYVVASPSYNNSQGAVWLVADPSNLGTLASNSAADVTVSPAQLAVADGNGSSVTLQATNDITVNSAVTVAGNLNLVAGNTVTLNAGLTSTASGDALVLAGTNFVNNAGAAALSTPNGRWLVYTASPGSNAAGGLTSGDADVFGATFTTNAPSTISSGNHFIYASAAPVTSTPTPVSTPTPTSTPTSSNAPRQDSNSGYAGALAWVQTLVPSASPVSGTAPGLASAGAGSVVTAGIFPGGDDSAKSDAGNGKSGADGKSLTAAGLVNTASNLVPGSVPGLTVIETGIRLPEGLRNSN